MRRFLASLLAFVASLAAGGAVAQLLAASTGATEEYILVFIATALVAILVTIPFFVAQFFAPSRRAVNRVAVALAAFFAAVLLILLYMSASSGGADYLESDLVLVAGLILPGLAVVLVQWLIVRGMLPSAYAAQFGRGAPPAA